MGTEDLSFHLFHARTCPRVIVNFHDERHGKPRDRPIQLNGSAPAQPYRERFDTVWNAASPLETVIARKIIAKAGRSSDCKILWQALNETCALLGLDDGAVDKVLPHLAFGNSCSMIFILGLPGAGKSLARECLTQKLKAMGVETRELSDYVYAFRDHLHGLMKLEPARGTGFEARTGGAFAVSDERALQPALNALTQAAAGSLSDSEVVLVEFARTDIVAALEEFGDIGNRCRVIYIQAPAQLRSARLSSRHEPPGSSTDGRTVTFTPSDNHMLPSNVERSIYPADNINRLMISPRWRDLIFWIENDIDDGGCKINASLDQFVEKVVSSYRHPAQASQAAPAVI
jgi:dephospho-CoA kinase